MREIEFRGKSKLSGKWVFGNLIIKKTAIDLEKLEEKVYNSKYSIQYLTKNGNYTTVEVIEDSIGQYIGNGKYGRIYEGMELYDEYAEENCTIEYDKEDYAFELCYDNYTERIESIEGLVPTHEEG